LKGSKYYTRISILARICRYKYYN